ncbi:sensor histidine kinase [Paenibacillus sp. GSMTC-2017]|uniref:sensor histidine kinase n=1 Tax=Paenibacillus sp. GSMTC-2017 TaxID=2794350 RepID=UPI001E3C4D91|nr:sensor histidine kinase [Paenibacillus sp. GSMTC-2017]
MRLILQNQASFSYLLGLHLLWWIITATSVVASLYGHFGSWGFYSTSCGDGFCNSYFQMNTSQLIHLEEIGISPDLYGSLTNILLALQNLSSWAIGFLLYRYGWKDRYCVMASLLLIATGTYYSTENHFYVDHPLMNVLVTGLNMIGVIYVVFLFLLPSGRFNPRWTAVFAFVWTTHSFLRHFVPNIPYLKVSPWFFFAYFIVLHLIVLYIQTERFFSESSPEKRRQLIWLIAGLAGFIVASILTPLPFFNEHGIWRLIVQITLYTSLLFLPFSIGLMILETRARNMSGAFNRTMVYALLSVFGIMVYVLLLGTFGALVQGKVPAIVSLLATGLIAVAFQPLREFVQREVNLLVYGEREDPYVVLSMLTKQLEASLSHRSFLPAVVAKLASILRVPYTTIDIYGQDGAERLATFGKETRIIRTIELEVNGEAVGQLVLGGEKLHGTMLPSKQLKMEDLIRQVSIAIHSVKLAEDLRKSRENLITAREEERRRLRRDLHDGLGSSLASMILRLDEAIHQYSLLGQPNNSKQVMEAVRLQLKESITDIRRLVYSLRPPTLDEFGLVFSLQELILQYQNPALQIIMEGAERDLEVSAAVEVAVFRIVQEALTNVIHHANASTCRIILRLEDHFFHIQITDNGNGMPLHVKPGVGVCSMRERAEELGGSFHLISAPDKGTDIQVHLPVEKRRTDCATC